MINQKNTHTEKEYIVSFIKTFYKKHGRFPSNKEIFKRITQDHHEDTYYTKLKKYNL